MSLSDNFRIMVQGVVNQSGRVGGKVILVVKEKVEIFISLDAEKKVGINFNFAKKGKPVEPLPITPVEEPSLVASPTETAFISVATIFFVTGGAIIALQLVQVLYKNPNKQGEGFYCNLAIPQGFKETNNFTRKFQLQYLFPVASFPSEEYIKKIAKKTGTSETEVFRNFVLYQKVIVSFAERATIVILSLLVFRVNIRICQLALTEIVGSAFIRTNGLAAMAIAYPLSFILTQQVCLIVTKFLQFIISIILAILKFAAAKIKPATVGLT